jgi:2'-5' RNA ligase
MGSQRLFVALEVPEVVRRDLRGMLEPWHTKLTGARWVAPEDWHVTLVFLGAVAADRVASLHAGLEVAVADATPFDTALSSFGGFPSQARARVVWAGLEDRAGCIGDLARSVGAALGAAPEDRPFSAHLTVARSDRPLRLPDDFVHARLPGAHVTVGEIVLFRSHLGRPAPRYEPLARLALGSPPG